MFVNCTAQMFNRVEHAINASETELKTLEESQLALLELSLNGKFD